MNEPNPPDPAIHEPISLARYDPRWPNLFLEERNRLLSLFPGRFLAIEHFGSTAIPGIRAKPILDMLAGVASMDEADALIPLLCGANYTAPEEYNRTLGDRRWLMRSSNGRRTHHLSIVVFEGSEWRRRLAFRDRLRGDPALSAAYEELKASLATAHRMDREAYTAGKRAFIESVLE